MKSKNMLRFRTVEALAVTTVILLGGAACSGSSRANGKTANESQLVKGCDIFGVYSQNRFMPLGTATRVKPDILAAKTEDSRFIFAPNEVIPVDGWEHSGSVAYPDNPQLLRNDIWYHVAPEGTSRAKDINAAWVSFAGVRGATTAPDPTGGYSTDYGKLAPLPPQCEIKPAIDASN